MMRKAFDKIYDTANEHGVSLRIGADVLRVGRVAEALRKRGIYA